MLSQRHGGIFVVIRFDIAGRRIFVFNGLINSAPIDGRAQRRNAGEGCR
jgi:hypothetical protein